MLFLGRKWQYMQGNTGLGSGAKGQSFSPAQYSSHAPLEQQLFTTQKGTWFLAICLLGFLFFFGAHCLLTSKTFFRILHLYRSVLIQACSAGGQASLFLGLLVQSLRLAVLCLNVPSRFIFAVLEHLLVFVLMGPPSFHSECFVLGYIVTQYG